MSQNTDAPDAYRIANTLRARILNGGFRAGEHLRQEKLAAEFAVSRLPIRAALAMLVQEGLLQHSLNRGMFVRTVTTRDLANIHEVRLVLERLALPLAAERRTEEDLDSAREHVALIQKSAQTGDFQGTVTAALELRRIVLGAAHSEALALALAVIDNRLRQLLVTTGELPSLAAFTVRIVERLTAQDGPGALDELEQHLQQVRRHHRSLAPEESDVEIHDEISAFASGEAADAADDDNETETITAEVRADILSGRLAAGARISERMISDAKGITRISAHSVITALVSQGLVSPSGPRTAARVRKVTVEGVLDHLTVLTEITALAARLASERTSTNDLSELHGAFRALGAAADSGAPEAIPQALFTISNLMVRATNNSVLIAAIDAIRWPLHFPGVIRFPEGLAISTGWSFHQALSFRDAERAEQIVRDVFSQVRGALTE